MPKLRKESKKTLISMEPLGVPLLFLHFDVLCLKRDCEILILQSDLEFLRPMCRECCEVIRI